MNRLNNKKVFIAAIVLLTLINLGFVITVVVFHRQDTHNRHDFQRQMERRGRFLEKELGFNKTQLENFHAARDEFRKQTEPLKDELRQLNRELIIEATSAKPDTAKCNKLSSQIGQIHSRIKHITYIHLIKVSKIATPQQAGKMSDFFLRILNDAPMHDHHRDDFSGHNSDHNREQGAPKQLP